MRTMFPAVAAVVTGTLLCGYPAAAGGIEIAADLTLKAATATPAARGAFSDVEVTLENGGSQRLVVLGLAAGEYGPASLVARSGGTAPTIGSIGLDPVDDREDGRATLSFRLGPVLRDLEPGTAITMQILTMRGPISFQLRVSGGTVSAAQSGT